MSQEYIEITEKTLDDAITMACQKLSVTSSRLEYEVIDEGKAGFFGIGARPAKIRARVKNDRAQAETSGKEPAGKEKAPAPKKAAEAKEKLVKPEKKEVKKEEKKETKTPEEAPAAENKPTPAPVSAPEEAPAVPEEKPAEKPAEKKEKPFGRRNDRRKAGKRAGSRRGDRRDRSERAADRDMEPTPFLTGAEVPQHQKKKEPVKARLTAEQIEETKKKAERFLKDIFAAIDMEVEINQEYDEDEALLSIEMEGDDMGVLIGKRGQTLDSLQYLLSLIVNKGVDGYIRVKADTEDYRDRRKRTLEQLAKRKASSVKRNRRPEALEPMNPYERRIIHSALQGDRYVTTYSEGEGEDRRVIITLKD